MFPAACPLVRCAKMVQYNLRYLRTARILSVTTILVLTAVQSLAGIKYQLRRVSAKSGTTVFTIWADGNSYRAEMEPSEEASELDRQYPIVISSDGGKTERALRPANLTWYERPSDTRQKVVALGWNAKVYEPSVTLTEESSNEQIAGVATRKFVLKTSYIVESEFGSEKVKLYKTRTTLLWIADVACAPKAVRQIQRMTFGAPELDEAVDRKMGVIDGLIVRIVDSLTERYEGGAPRTFGSTVEVISPRCLEVGPSLFAIPKGYTYQEPIIAGPG